MFSRFKIISIMMTVFAVGALHAQDLQNQRIRKLQGSKTAIYLTSGIFHTGGGPKVESELKAIRHSYSSKSGYERLVFDFKTPKMPKVYGHISSEEKKVYLDFFDTSIGQELNSFGSSKYVESVNIFPLSRDSLSVELVLKDKLSADIFWLENPGRLVIDLKM